MVCCLSVGEFSGEYFHISRPLESAILDRYTFSLARECPVTPVLHLAGPVLYSGVRHASSHRATLELCVQKNGLYPGANLVLCEQRDDLYHGVRRSVLDLVKPDG